MALKFFPPLGNVAHKITQTNHGHNINNPNDLSKQNAIDLSALGNQDLYAVHDGSIVGGGVADPARPYFGLYATLDIGLPFYILYVHGHQFLPTGTKVKRGQIIGKAYPMKGSHLHLANKNKSGKAPHPDPMAYMPRGADYTTTYSVIEKAWFKNGRIDWNLFQDLYLDTQSDMSNYPKRGQKIRWLQDTYIKPAQTTDCNVDERCVLALTGSVFEVLSDEVRMHDGYGWMDVRCLNAQGWARMYHEAGKKSYYQMSTSEISLVDGSYPVKPPEPPITPPVDDELTKVKLELEQCRSELAASEASRKLLEMGVKELNEKSEDLEAQVENLTNQILDRDESYKKLYDEVQNVLKPRIRELEVMYDKAVEEKIALQMALERCVQSNRGCLPFSNLLGKQLGNKVSESDKKTKS